jgi:hypothetical protein
MQDHWVTDWVGVASFGFQHKPQKSYRQSKPCPGGWFDLPEKSFAASGLVSVAESSTTTTAATTTTTVSTPASSSVSTPTAKAASTRSAAKTTALRLGSGLIYVYIAGAQLCSVGPGDGLLCLFVICHFHKAKTPWLARIAVAHDRHIINLSVGLKRAPQFIFGDVVIQVADIDILHKPFFGWKQLPQLLAGLLIRARAERVAESSFYWGQPTLKGYASSVKDANNPRRQDRALFSSIRMLSGKELFCLIELTDDHV